MTEIAPRAIVVVVLGIVDSVRRAARQAGHADVQEIRSCQGDTGVEVIQSLVAFFVANFVL